MELKVIATGGIYVCSEEEGNRLLAEGGYEKVTADPVKKAVHHKAAPRKAAPSA